MKNRTELLRMMENDAKHMLIQGSAGTGKTHLLKQFFEMTQKRVISVAPTGLAASHFGGATIHSVFKFKPSLILPDEVEEQGVFQDIDILIIDEVSMVSCNLLDGIDLSLKKSRKNTKPFGGVKVIMFGDVFQLGPVVPHSYKSILHELNENYDKSYYFFNAEVVKEIEKNKTLSIYTLKQNYRQKEDPLFYNLLEVIKTGKCTDEALDMINSNPLRPSINSTILTLDNYTVNFYNALSNINKKKYKAIPQVSYFHRDGCLELCDHPSIEPQEFSLDTLVIFTKNNKKMGYFNGTQGRITGFNTILGTEDILHSINIKITSGDYEGDEVTVFEEKTFLMRPCINEKTHKIQTIISAEIVSFPLRCASALTIHKSQGLTLENICIDKSGYAFDSGQIYTALSRARCRSKVYVKEEIKKEDIFADVSVIEFLDSHASIGVS